VLFRSNLSRGARFAIRYYDATKILSLVFAPLPEPEECLQGLIG
jgi:hypothetical protein